MSPDRDESTPAPAVSGSTSPFVQASPAPQADEAAGTGRPDCSSWRPPDAGAECDLSLDLWMVSSAAANELSITINRVGPTDAPVLIVGESGTGKEVTARAIHRASRRRGLFVPVNMAAVPHELAESQFFGHERGAFTGAGTAYVGYCETAHGGTLFLDEVTEMEPGLQAKLLRFLEDHMVQNK